MTTRLDPPPEFAREFVFSRTFDAPRSAVFAAWTDPAILALWWGPKGFTSPRCELDARIGGAIHIDMRGPDGVVHPMAGEVRELVEPARFVFTAGSLDEHGERLFQVRNAIDFAEQGGRTLVTVRARFEWITPGMDSSLGGMDQGWNESLDRMVAVVLARAADIRRGSTDGNESSSELGIELSRVFDAPVELVWDVWTRAEHIARWWGPSGFSTTIEQFDFRPGGRFKHTMHGPDGTDYPNLSVFRAIVPYERIDYTHSGGEEDGPGASFQGSWRFQALAGGRTTVTISLTFPTRERRDFVIREFGAIAGGKQTLARFDEHVASVRAADELVIERTFDAPRETVFAAWTELERLKSWWGPKGFEWLGGTLDLRPGGRFHYGMRAPGGGEMWGKFVWREIVRPERLVYVVSFSDATGSTTRHPLAPTWPLELLNTLLFVQEGARTKLVLHGLPLGANDAERETFRKAHEGVRGGFKGTLDQLEAFLAGA